MTDLNWSPSEKTIARRIYDQVLARELQQLIHDVKHKAAEIHEPSQLWDLENWLTERRKDIESKYDYRYSVLPRVFGILMSQGLISKDDLRGLDREKVEMIVRISSLLSK